MFALRLDVYIHQTNETQLQKDIGFIRSTLETLANQGALMAGELQTLQEKVTKIETVGDSVVAAMQGLAQQIRDLSTQPAALIAMANELDAKADSWAAAVAANTPTP